MAKLVKSQDTTLVASLLSTRNYQWKHRLRNAGAGTTCQHPSHRWEPEGLLWFIGHSFSCQPNRPGTIRHPIFKATQSDDNKHFTAQVLRGWPAWIDDRSHASSCHARIESQRWGAASVIVIGKNARLSWPCQQENFYLRSVETPQDPNPLSCYDRCSGFMARGPSDFVEPKAADKRKLINQSICLKQPSKEIKIKLNRKYSGSQTLKYKAE